MAKAKKKIGAREKIGPAEKQKVYGILSVGGSMTDAANIIGVDPKTLRNARKRDKSFSLGVNKAVAEGKQRLLQKMEDAEPWQAAAWLLERRWGKEFGKKLDVTSKNEAIKGYVGFDTEEV